MNNYFSDNIKRLRKERNLTQDDLAEFLGVSFQAVSKWERGESYPDFELLPKLAVFFGVSTDYLLGVDKAKSEDEILAYIDKFDNGMYNSAERSIGFMSEAYSKYPSDFRILSRYMTALIVDNIDSGDYLKNKKEIFSIYDRIQNFCTNDRIRMYSKTQLIHYYRDLIAAEKGGITEQDLFNLIDEMPRLRDSKEYLMSYIPLNPEEVKAGCQKLFDSLLFYFDNAVSHYLWGNTALNANASKEEIQDSIDALEMMMSIFNSIYSDGNYGSCWKFAIYNYGYLGQFYYRINNNEKAVENLRKCAELAKQFDTMPDVTERTALLFKGTNLNKQEDVAILLDTSLCKQMTHHMLNSYPLSDEFKSGPEFKEILDIMK